MKLIEHYTSKGTVHFRRPAGFQYTDIDFNEARTTGAPTGSYFAYKTNNVTSIYGTEWMPDMHTLSTPDIYHAYQFCMHQLEAI